MLTTLYKVGKQVWIVPPDHVTTSLTGAFDKINKVKVSSLPEQFTEDERSAFHAACNNDEITVVE